VITVYKYAVPVDDRPHEIPHHVRKIVHAACVETVDVVQVWAEVDTAETYSPSPVWVQVFGTGQPLPLNFGHEATVVTANGALVWHVYRVPASAGAS
jgi:hypothetical protein